MGCAHVHKKIFAFFLGFGVKLHLRAQEGFCLVGCVHEVIRYMRYVSLDFVVSTLPGRDYLEV